MTQLELKIRKIETSEEGVAAFESLDDAIAWLAERPSMVEVLGPADPQIDDATNKALRGALRPLDDQERIAKEVRYQEELAELRRQDEEDSRREWAQSAPNARSEDPNRPMAIQWDRQSGLRLVDPADQREITELARDAVLAWVVERDGWLRERGQHVAGAQVTVWPGPIPGGDGSPRVQYGGQFEPAPGLKEPISQ